MTGSKENLELTQSEIDFLISSADGFVSLKHCDNVYNYIAEKMISLLPDSIIVVSSVNKDATLTKIEAISGIGHFAEKVIGLFGRHPVGMEFEMLDIYHEKFLTENLFEPTDDISVLTSNKINKKISNSLLKIFNITKIYSIGFVKNEMVNASLSILLRNKDKISNHKIIKTFVSQAASAIYRHQAEEALFISEQKFKSLFENIQEIYFESSLEGKLLLISPAFSSLLKYSIDELMVMNTSEIYQNPNERNMLVERLKNEGQIKNYEIMLIDKFGESITCSINAKIIFDKDAVPQKICGSIRDISEWKKTEEQLKDALATKDKFFSIISHDLKSPLSGFIGLSKTLSEDIDKLDISEIREIANTLLSSSENIYSLLKNLLDWSRIKTNKIDIKFEPMNIKTLIDKVFFTFDSIASKKQISLNNFLKDDCIIFSDTMILEIVLRNLVSNAIKFTHANGQIKVKSTTQKNSINIIVEDNGIGIEEKYLYRLFSIEEPYYRQGTEGEPSSGLGLFLSGELISKIGGEIKIESSIDIGSRFIINLPYDNKY